MESSPRKLSPNMPQPMGNSPKKLSPVFPLRSPNPNLALPALVDILRRCVSQVAQSVELLATASSSPSIGLMQSSAMLCSNCMADSAHFCVVQQHGLPQQITVPQTMPLMITMPQMHQSIPGLPTSTLPWVALPATATVPQTVPKPFVDDEKSLKGKRSARRRRGRDTGIELHGQSTERTCHACGTKDTPEWRRGPDGPKTLCNACGLRNSKRIRREKERAEKEGDTDYGSED